VRQDNSWASGSSCQHLQKSLIHCPGFWIMGSQKVEHPTDYMMLAEIPFDFGEKEHPQSWEPSSRLSWCPSDREDGTTELAQGWLKFSNQHMQKLTLPRQEVELDDKPWWMYCLISWHLQTALNAHLKGWKLFASSFNDLVRKT